MSSAPVGRLGQLQLLLALAPVSLCLIWELSPVGSWCLGLRWPTGNLGMLAVVGGRGRLLPWCHPRTPSKRSVIICRGFPEVLLRQQLPNVDLLMRSIDHTHSFGLFGLLEEIWPLMLRRACIASKTPASLAPCWGGWHSTTHEAALQTRVRTSPVLDSPRCRPRRARDVPHSCLPRRIGRL